ncbi:MAG TPA: glycosyltransferase [Candidatus Microsaccharimonas sp.]|jgi:glycosyltransferase involved in cell wall biosynthesis
MKILIASDLHYPTINGVATFGRTLAIGLANRGHEVMVIAPSQTSKKFKEIDVNHVVVRTASVPFVPYQNFRISPTPGREVKKAILEFDPDIIHIQMLMWIGQATMKYGNKFGIPIVSTNHAMPENLMDNILLLAPIARPINFMLRQYGMRFHSKADYITMPTESAIKMFKATEKMKMTTPMEAVSNGIDLVRFQPGKPGKKIYEQFHLPQNVPIITYVGRVDVEKHLPILIKAFAEVRKKHNAHLMIVGSGQDTLNLKQIAHELGVYDDITFTGRVTEEDKVLLHQIGTVFAMPSPTELQSIATLEAMASGQPVVAVDAGALKELCQNERNGYLCDKDDVARIAEGLSRIIADPKERKRMSQESLAIAKTHDLNTTLDRFEAIYADLTNSSIKNAT